jgi:endonuclease/exonuclease/phosphatase family metal-dependent hydrolase
MRSHRKAHLVCSSVLLAASAGTALAADSGLRVVSWNISNYSGGADAIVGNAIFGEFEGRSMSPDLFVAQEMLSQSAVNSMLNILNNTAGSPGDYAAGPFTNGPDTDNAMFYRTSKLVYLGTAILPADPGTTGAPRDVNRYDLRLVGYDAEAATISIYSSHMKSSSSSSSQARRLVEAQKIRTDAENLPVERNFILGGDFNIQSSSQSAYQWMVGSQVNNNGRFADPINTPGNWNNNGAYRIVHTQDPSGAGGMDDRHDQILMDLDLGDGDGLDYKGEFGLPYSTTTWNDLNHSYRSYGNDGTTFNVSMAIAGNTMVGASIATSLVQLASGGGHLPVLADLVVPGVIGADSSIDLGTIPATVQNMDFVVGNDGDTALWGADGINTINYTLDADPGINVPAGLFSDEAGGTFNTHTVTIDATGLAFGTVITGDIRVISNDVDTPLLTIPVTAFVGGCAASDIAEPFGTLDVFDVFAYLDLFNAGDIDADWNDDGVLDIFDVFGFLDSFNAGCP